MSTSRITPKAPIASKPSTSAPASAPGSAPAEKEKKRSRPEFTMPPGTKLPLDAPPQGFDFAKHRKLSKKVFTATGYVLYRASFADFQAARFTEKAKAFRAEAEQIAKFGDPAKIKLAKKRDKILAALKELDAALGAAQ